MSEPKYIPGKYIVVYKQSAPQSEIDKHIADIAESGGEIGHKYDSVFKGFSAKLTEDHLTNFKGSDLIDYIEPDQEITVNPITSVDGPVPTPSASV